MAIANKPPSGLNILTVIGKKVRKMFRINRFQEQHRVETHLEAPPSSSQIFGICFVWPSATASSIWLSISRGKRKKTSLPLLPQTR